MQIEDQIDPIRLAPRQQVINHVESRSQPGVLAFDLFLFDGQGEQVVVHREADAVEARFRQQVHIRTGHVVLEPELVEFRAVLRAGQVGDPSSDGVLSPFSVDAQHVAFLQHPTAQPHPPQYYLSVLPIDNPRVLRLQKPRGLRVGNLESEHHYSRQKQRLLHGVHSGSSWARFPAQTGALLDPSAQCQGIGGAQRRKSAVRCQNAENAPVPYHGGRSPGSTLEQLVYYTRCGRSPCTHRSKRLDARVNGVSCVLLERRC